MPQILLDFLLSREFGWDYDTIRRRNPKWWNRDILTCARVCKQIDKDIADQRHE